MATFRRTSRSISTLLIVSFILLSLLSSSATAWQQRPIPKNALGRRLPLAPSVCPRSSTSTGRKDSGIHQPTPRRPVSLSSASATARTTLSSPLWTNSRTSSIASIPWKLPTLNGNAQSLTKRSRTTTAAASLQKRKRVSRSIEASSTAAATRTRSFRVYCDLDGVLVDFEAGIRQLFPHESLRLKDGFNVDDLHRGTMWERVQDHGSFFQQLPWTDQGKVLWQAIAPLKPDILTGVPTYPDSRVEKFRWCQRELGVPVAHHDRGMAGNQRYYNDDEQPLSSSQQQQRYTTTTRVITCWSRDKYLESGKDAVLIDDRIELKANWEKAGGIFIHHNGNAHETIQKLRQAGILMTAPSSLSSSSHEQPKDFSYRGMRP